MRFLMGFRLFRPEPWTGFDCEDMLDEVEVKVADLSKVRSGLDVRSNLLGE